MTFKKNLLVMVSAILLVLVMAWLVRMPRDVLVYGLTMTIAAVAVALAIEDLWRKMFNGRDDLTWQYFVGFGLVLLGVLSFLWASESVEVAEMILRLGVAAFFGALGGFWFYGPYKTSVTDAEGREAGHWERVAHKVEKAKTAEAKAKILAKNLRYRLAGDALGGSLVFDKPLAYYEGECMTLSEAQAVAGEDEAIATIRERAERYINALLKEDE